MTPGPKVAGDDGPGTGPGDVERYEALRRQALEGHADGWRLGLDLLRRRGVAAWLRAVRPIPAPELRPGPAVAPVGNELVGVLANMALACAGIG